MRKLVIKGMCNKPIAFELKNSLISTLKEINKWTIDKDCPGYFFETNNTDPEYIKHMDLPIFINSYGICVAPTDLNIVDFNE